MIERAEIERAIERNKMIKKLISEIGMIKARLRASDPLVPVVEPQRYEEYELLESILTAELSHQENAPLTLEELISMNGKPVWCQTGDGYEGWALVIIDKYENGGHYLYLFSDDLTRDGINECFEPDEDFINLTFSDDPDGHFGLHALGWRAYRYEPKGEQPCLK